MIFFPGDDDLIIRHHWKFRHQFIHLPGMDEDSPNLGHLIRTAQNLSETHRSSTAGTRIFDQIGEVSGGEADQRKDSAEGGRNNLSCGADL